MIKEIECSRVINKSKLPEADFVVNPFVGCLHNCAYCYARFMKRFTGHTEPWGTFVDVKKNIGPKTKNEIGKIPHGSTILLSSVTDPYQPIERKYRVTRAFLENVIGEDVCISVLTKSSLVERDIDLFRQIGDISVGLSFSSHDDQVRRVFEPGTSSVESKVNTLVKLNKENLSTYAFLGPILPEITDLEAVFRMLSATGVGLVMVENLNIRGAVFPSLMKTISQHFPHLEKTYVQIKEDPKTYWEPIKAKVLTLSKRYKLPIMIYFDH